MKVWYWTLSDSADYDVERKSTDPCCGAVSLTRKGAKDHFCAYLMAEGWPVWQIAMLLVTGCVCYRYLHGEPEDWHNVWFDTLEVS